MWFKKASTYHISGLEHITEEALGEKIFKGCDKHQLEAYGWLRTGDSEDAPVIHTLNGMHLLRLQIETKVIPPSAIKDRVAIRTEEFVQRTGKKPGKADRVNIKEAVIKDMTPDAYSRKKTIQGFIDPKTQRLVINSLTEKDKQCFITRLRDASKKIGIIGILPEVNAPQLMRTWLYEVTPPEGYQFGKACKLLDHDRGRGSITFKNQDITTDEIRAHLEDTTLPEEIELTWKDKVQFTLTSSLDLKGIKFTDILKGEAMDGEHENKQSIEDACFIIMSAELILLTTDLMEIFKDKDKDQDKKT